VGAAFFRSVFRSSVPDFPKGNEAGPSGGCRNFDNGWGLEVWYQLGNGLRIVNGGNGQWKRRRPRMGHALDDDDDDDDDADGDDDVGRQCMSPIVLYCKCT